MENIDKNIEILENVEPYGIIKQNEYDFVTKEKYIQAQKDLIKAYKELEHKNKELKEEYSNEQKSELLAYKILQEKKLKLEEENATEFARGYSKCILDFNKKYIPVSLVEEKIEELKEKGESDLRTYGFAIETHLAKQVLQELLEKRK